MATTDYPQNVVELLYRTPTPEAFALDLGSDLATAIEGAIPQAKVTHVSVDAGYTFLRIRPEAGYVTSTESALRHFAQMPGAVVVDIERVSDHLWIRARVR